MHMAAAVTWVCGGSLCLPWLPSLDCSGQHGRASSGSGGRSLSFPLTIPPHQAGLPEHLAQGSTVPYAPVQHSGVACSQECRASALLGAGRWGCQPRWLWEGPVGPGCHAALPWSYRGRGLQHHLEPPSSRAVPQGPPSEEPWDRSGAQGGQARHAESLQVLWWNLATHARAAQQALEGMAWWCGPGLCLEAPTLLQGR